VHPPQAEDEAEEAVVCPPAPLETKPQVDMSLQTFGLLQSGQVGFSPPKTSFSNWQPHPLHWYSKIGIGTYSLATDAKPNDPAPSVGLVSNMNNYPIGHQMSTPCRL
jgi:hypothetical protein